MARRAAALTAAEKRNGVSVWVAATLGTILSLDLWPCVWAQQAFRQPGLDAQNTAKLPFTIPQSNPPASYPLASLFSQLSPSSLSPWIPLCSPVVDSSGVAYWALINSDVGIKLVSVPLVSPPSVLSSIDISNDRTVDLFASRAKSAFLSLGRDDILLLLFKVNDRIFGFRTLKADSIRSTFNAGTLRSSRFDPIMTDSGTEAFFVSESGGSPCIFRIAVDSGQTDCKLLGFGPTSPSSVALSLDDRANLLITADGTAIKIPFSGLQTTSMDSPTNVGRNTPGVSRLQAVPGRPDLLVSIGFEGTVSLLNANSTPWEPIWWSTIPLSNFVVAADADRGWLYLCVGAVSDEPAAEGRLTAIRISDGQLGWNGGSGVVPCSKDGVFVSSDGSVLTVSQSGTISLLNIDTTSGDVSTRWSTGIPPQNPLINFPVLPPAVWSNGGSGVFILSGASAVGFADFPPAPTTTTTTTISSSTTSSSATSLSASFFTSITETKIQQTDPSAAAVPTETGSVAGGLTGTNLALAIALPLLAFVLIAIVVAFLLIRRKRLEGEKPPSDPPFTSESGYRDGPGELPTVGAGAGIRGITSSYPQKGLEEEPTSKFRSGESTMLASGVASAGAGAFAVSAITSGRIDDDDDSSFKSALAEEWSDGYNGRRESVATVASEATIRSPLQTATPDSSDPRSERIDTPVSITARSTPPGQPELNTQGEHSGHSNRQAYASFGEAFLTSVTPAPVFSDDLIPSPPDDALRPLSGASFPQAFDAANRSPSSSPTTQPSLPRSANSVGIARSTSTSRATSPSSSGYAASVSSTATARPRQSFDRLSRTTSPRNSMQSHRLSVSDSEYWDSPVNVAPLVPLPSWASDDEDREERWRDLVYGESRPMRNVSNTDAETFTTVPEFRSERSTPSGRGGHMGEMSSRNRSDQTDNEGGYVTAGTSMRSAQVSDGYVTAQDAGSRSDMDSGTDGYQTGREA